MSKHDNIYNILGKLEALQPKEQKQVVESKQTVYESVDAQGSILSGVAKVEKQLSEKYMGFKKTVASIKKSGSAENPEAVAAAIGRKKYGKEKFQKAAAAGKKLGEGDMDEEMLSPKDKKFAALAKPKDKITYADKIAGAKKKDEGNEFSGALAQAKAQHKDSFEVDGKEYPVKESGLQAYLGNKKYGKEGMNALRKAGQEHAGKEKMANIRAKYDKFDESDMEEGNLFTGNLAKARAQGKKQADLDGDGDMERVEEGFEELKKYMADKEKGAKQGGGAGKKQGTRYGGSLQKDDEGDKEEATDDAPKKKGRPKKDKFAETAPPGAKAERMVKGIKKSLSKDGKLSKKDKSIAYATTWKAHNAGKLKEGVNFSEMMKETHGNVEEMLMELNKDIAEFKKTGHMSDKLRDCLEMHRYSKKPVVDEVVVPAPTPAYGKDMVTPAERLAPHAGVGKGPIGQALGQAGTMAKNVGRFIQGKPEIPTLEDQELNELAKLAGLSEAKKCNHTKKDEKCPVHGMKECSGMYESKEHCDDCHKPIDDCSCDKEKVDECGDMSPMSNMGQEGNFSVSTNMNSDGTKSITVNADGRQADALAQMLKMAGLESSHAEQEPKAIVIQAGPEENVEEERDIEYANTPDEEQESVDAIVHQGNDLNREKEQYADKPKSGDNPMATPQRESIEMPKSVSRMLEGIKKVEEQSN